MKYSGFLNRHGWICLLLLAGFLARLLAFQINFFFTNDVHLFQFWAVRLFENGFSSFFGAEFFSDYPPVYLYVLYLLGALRAGVQAIFGEEYWRVLDSPTFRFFTFLPAILADLGIGFFIYKIAEKKNTARFALFVAAAWLFNPAIILISSVWGQVESVFVLMLLVSLYFMRKKKLIPAYVLFGLAVLTKPQSLFLGPVYLYSAISFLRESDNKKMAALELAASIGAGILAMLLVSLPFGLGATGSQLIYGMGLYGHATVNAANFWHIIAGNWGEFNTVVGVAIVLAIIAAALLALHKDHTKYGGRHFYLIAAALFIVIFTFSVRMHERYLFPGIVFLLIYYLENRKRGEFIFYWAFSAVFFINCLEVLRWANADFDRTVLEESSIGVLSYVTVFLAGALVFVLARSLLVKYRQPEPLPPDTLKEPPPMSRRDFAFIAALIIVYSVLAFTRLGDTRTPQSTWIAGEYGSVVRVDLLRETHISQFQFLLGARNDIPFSLRASSDGVEWETVYTVRGGDVFAWHFIPLEIYARYIEIAANPGLRLQEAAFRGADGEQIRVPVIKGDPLCWCCQGATALFDEQSLVPERRSFMNSTYFDEIYHPRTGYEFVHGLPVFEWTHPPLGKVFMSWSINAFGMTPFAWRLPGTVFGILMIPLIYAFARKLLKSNNYALFAAVIFTFDFMLFSHTRLATIDTFVTFFVLAMYFLMYCYLSGIEKNSLGKSLGLLALCGVAMGLAVASKWQGVYGALGLPILFFPAMYKLFKRDRRQAVITFAACFGFFVAVPLGIYILSYIPFVAASTCDYGFFRTIWNNQDAMFNYHSYGVLGATHHFASQWWSWPLVQTPLWQYRAAIPDPALSAGMSSMGNPAVWWVGIFAAGFAVYSLAKKRRHENDTVFLLAAYAANFLPWIFVTRLTFIYHYFPSVPFIVLLIALIFRHHIRRGWACVAYAAVVIVLFIVFYPVLSGMEVSVDFVQRLRWFPNWWLA